MARTLLQRKNAPIHIIYYHGRSIIARTLCGVDPYRKGVTTQGVNSGKLTATCKVCLREQKKTQT